MITVVIGGSGSGKSQRAESLVQQMEGKRIYLATMQVYGEEGKKRVKRHVSMRQGKGFETVECALYLEQLSLPKESVVLLEDLPNLVANEMFEEQGRKENCLEMIKKGIHNLQSQADHLVIVTGNVTESGELFENEMREYMDVLNACNAYVSSIADRVEEVVCGIPVVVKNKMVC